jgi:hypothetical protein
MPKCSYLMESAGAMHVKMQENMQYVFYDVCHNVGISTVGGPPREVRTPQTEDAVLQIFDDDGRSRRFEELYLPRSYQYFRRTE